MWVHDINIHSTRHIRWTTHYNLQHTTCTCCFTSIHSLCNFTGTSNSPACDHAINYAMNREFANVDQYSIYTPSFAMPSDMKNYAEKYFNRLDVQRAMHVNLTGIPYKWIACSCCGSDVLIKSWKDSQFSMLPTHRELIAAGLRIWVFSRDTDSVVPVTAIRFSLNHLKLPVKTRWYPWYSGNKVGGWTEVYHGLTFATVRGAGHEVPLSRPKIAFRLFRSILAGKELPKSKNKLLLRREGKQDAYSDWLYGGIELIGQLDTRKKA
ncbi:Peptidase_S10 domain-containing protein [Cinnamomum micranthum f. kanehirae]|uniref:Peptidase_S10 domain-containing protein n=1 Tax=Cinnamomum micranthum f. kanehirae TaxID=337451 RepID=A0A443PBK1_9MAGN|nr:Peptidase_S10 domain-containing protein [Cinnamomum micranthum f. kanehirae]